MITLWGSPSLRPSDVARDSGEVSMIIVFVAIALVGIATLLIATFLSGRRLEAKAGDPLRAKPADDDRQGSSDDGRAER